MSIICLKVGSNEWKHFMTTQFGYSEKQLNYLITGFHFKFENADEQNDVEWFKHFSKKHQDFMDFWCYRTYPTFKWNCYRKFRGDNDPCKEKVKIMEGLN